MAHRSPRHLRVFISSPGDVRAERDIAQNALVAVQRSQAWVGKFTIETLRWDDADAPFPMDARIPPQLGFDLDGKTTSACDLVIVILWSRIGTPLASPRRADDTQY